LQADHDAKGKRPVKISNRIFAAVLTLGVMLGDADVVLVQPDRDVPLGSRIA